MKGEGSPLPLMLDTVHPAAPPSLEGAAWPRGETTAGVDRGLGQPTHHDRASKLTALHLTLLVHEGRTHTRRKAWLFVPEPVLTKERKLDAASRMGRAVHTWGRQGAGCGRKGGF